MKRLSVIAIFACLVVSLGACAPQPPIRSDWQSVTVAPSTAATQAASIAPLQTRADTPTPATCATIDTAALPAYSPQQRDFAPLIAEGTRLRGIFYEPRDYPNGTWLHADNLTESLKTELGLLNAAGVNTLQLQLPLGRLFRCTGARALPHIEAITQLERLLSVAATLDMHVILRFATPTDATPIPPFEQILATLGARYQDEGTVILWDVQPDTSEQTPLPLLLNYAQALRRVAPQQRLTATYSTNPADTSPFVDVISFRNPIDETTLRQMIALVRAQSPKPILLNDVRYPLENGDELLQRDRLYAALTAAENNQLYGWVVSRAFDHPTPLCPTTPCERDGLWNTSYFPKRALDAVTAFTLATPADD